MSAQHVGETLQALAIGFMTAVVLVWFPPQVGEFLWDLPPGWLPAGHYVAGATPAPPVAWVDPSRADFSTGGIGALSSIADTAVDPALVSERERQAAIDAWVNDTAPQTALDWSTVDAAVARFLAPLSPVERAHVEVDATWRTGQHTGEIPRIMEMAGATA
jgi:hypothetical protein